MFQIILVIIGISGIALVSSAVKGAKYTRAIPDILKNIIKQKPLEHFVLIKKTEEEQHYYYKENIYTFDIESNPQRLIIRITSEKKLLLHVTYNKTTKIFEDKTVSSALMEQVKGKIERIDAFIQWCASHPWNFASDFQVVDEVVNEELFFEISKEMLKNNLQSDLSASFLSTIEKIENIQHQLKEFDAETQYRFKETVKHDLYTLLTHYLELEEEKKETYKEKMLSQLKKLDDIVHDLNKKISEKKEDEVKKLLLLMNERYK